MFCSGPFLLYMAICDFPVDGILDITDVGRLKTVIDGVFLCVFFRR